MQNHVKRAERNYFILEVARLIVDGDLTVRKAAEETDRCKSTIHKYMRKELPEINPLLGEEVAKVMEKNKEERHIRGGLATKNKYLNKKGLV